VSAWGYPEVVHPQVFGKNTLGRKRKIFRSIFDLNLREIFQRFLKELRE
jgi:hypothetical protein